MDKSTFELTIELISAVSQILWPIFFFIVALLYRKEISAILKRLKRGKILGQELELEKEIDVFRVLTDEASNSIPISEDEETSHEIANILNKSAKDAKIGILMLSREIEKELIKITASQGLLKEYENRSAKAVFKILAGGNEISKATAHSLDTFWDIRNKVVHGRAIEDEGQLIRILDIGSSLLRTLRSIPHSKFIVTRPNITLYSDENCSKLLTDVYGLELQSVSRNGIKNSKSIFPTTKKNYNEGDEVAWEWNLDKVWNRTWYKDENGNPKNAWDSAGEFVGRLVHEI